MIIDCHTHWGIVWEDRDHEDPAKWLEVLDHYGIDMAVQFGHYNLHRCDMCREDNDRLSRIAARFPDRLIPLGSAWAQMGEDAVEEARHCLEDLGMKGLKFHTWLQGFSTADPVMAEICTMASDLGRFLLFHDGTPCYSLPEQIGGLARRFPKVQFVLGHAGLLWHWRTALEVARLPNVWPCLTGPHMRTMEIYCQRSDPDRLLWGSDFGFGFANPIEYRLTLIRRAKIDDGLRERILGDNPRRLLGV